MVLPELVEAFTEGIPIELANQSLQPLIAKTSFEAGLILMDCFAYQRNIGAADCNNLLVLKNCQLHPEKILTILSKNPSFVYADSLIAVAAYNNQEELYNFAAANNRLSYKISQNNDPLVKIISHMARVKTGRQYFPFLDNLYKGRMRF